MSYHTYSFKARLSGVLLATALLISPVVVSADVLDDIRAKLAEATVSLSKIMASLSSLSSSQQAQVAGSSTALSQTFTTVGPVSFTVPAGVTSLKVTMAGGGGGGSGANNGGTWGVGGGGGGGYSQYIMSVTPGQVITGSVGAGGAAGGYSSSGSSGNNTTFGSLVTTGGGGGAYGSWIPGAGGTPGGQSGGSTAAGTGGASGAGQGLGTGAGTAGKLYGGGGGGGNESSSPAPGAGAQGWIKVEWVPTPTPTITSISPMSATQGFTVPVTIRGTNLSAVARLNFYLPGNNVPIGSLQLISVSSDGTQVTTSIDGKFSGNVLLPGNWEIALATADPGAVITNKLGFTIAAAPTPPITVTAPNGGEVWQLGSTHTIKWTPYDPTTGINPSGTVKAYLEQEGLAGTFVTVGEVFPDGRASIHWAGSLDQKYENYPVPGSYYIRVTNTQTGASDRSDNPFTIVARNTITADLKVNGSDGLMSMPAGSANYTFSWTSNADACEIWYDVNKTTQSIYSLPASGSRTIQLTPDTSNPYYVTTGKMYVAILCSSRVNVEGTASDQVYMTPATTDTVSLLQQQIANIQKQMALTSPGPAYDALKAQIILLQQQLASITTTVPAPTITVTAPNGGEKQASNFPLFVSWTTTNFASDKQVSIGLYGPYQGGVPLNQYNLGNVANSGSGWFNLPSTLSPGSYKINIGTIFVKDADSASDWSNNFFTIGNLPVPVITSISPSSGFVGANVTLAGTGFMSSNTVNLIPKNGGPNGQLNAPSSGSSISFNIPNLASGMYDIEVGNQAGSSNRVPFTVTSPTSVPTVPDTISQCSGLNMVWRSGETIIRTDPYNYSGDTCQSYRRVSGSEISPSCYTLQQCTEGYSGSCVSIPLAQNQCLLKPVSTVTVLSPNGGEIGWSSQWLVSWKVSSDISKVSVGLYKNDASYKWITTDLPANITSYNWTPSSIIPISDTTAGAVFKIYVLGYKTGGGNADDKSDTPFRIISPAVTPPSSTLPPTVQPPVIQPPVIQPPAFTERNLYRGMKGDGVKKLQELLAKDPQIYPSGEITGYYGFLTQAAVQNFQCKYGLVCDGDPETTGYGVVGPKTMMKINEVASNTGGGSTGGSGTTTIPPMSSNTIADLQAQIKSLMEQVNALTAKLNALPR